MGEPYEQAGFFLLAFLAVIPAAPAIHYAQRTIRPVPSLPRRTAARRFLVTVAAAFILYVAVSVDAFLVEPNWPRVTAVTITAGVREPIEVLHLSDLHIEAQFPRREQWLVETVARLSPDLILITGDIHQTDNEDVESIRRVLSQIDAPLGVYACQGFDDVRMLREAAPHVRMLVNETVEILHGSDRIGIAGLAASGRHEPLYAELAGAGLAVAMNHTPDLADEAVSHSVDLYLCGHTHGGQVRIPFWGAIITNCQSGKKYEGGLYQTGKTWIHTSRGLGLEPHPAPQVRFFCRPEITRISVRPRNNQAR